VKFAPEDRIGARLDRAAERSARARPTSAPPWTSPPSGPMPGPARREVVVRGRPAIVVGGKLLPPRAGPDSTTAPTPEVKIHEPPASKIEPAPPPPPPAPALVPGEGRRRARCRRKARRGALLLERAQPHADAIEWLIVEATARNGARPKNKILVGEIADALGLSRSVVLAFLEHVSKRTAEPPAPETPEVPTP